MLRLLFLSTSKRYFIEYYCCEMNHISRIRFLTAFYDLPRTTSKISKLVLEHLSNAEQHVITGKKQIEGVVCEHLTRRKQLEDDIKKKDKDLVEKRCQMERKQKEFKEKEAKVDEAHRKYQAELDNYTAQLRKSENTKVGSVLANTACATVGALLQWQLEV
ncbi:unnamed protein product [Mytilus edulis]|uniref:Uncharacterized protein n=1 Tax=Mytilus edulis TaxID=6550 RepID=A0A8S3U814_MYTED|nr:unnamed protein product [Mytilus edulis]